MKKNNTARDALFGALLGMLDEHWAESKSEAVDAILEKLNAAGFLVVSRDLLNAAVDDGASAMSSAEGDRYFGLYGPLLKLRELIEKAPLPEPPK